MGGANVRRDELREAIARISANPILLDGDSEKLLTILRVGTDASSIRVADFESLQSGGTAQAYVAVLAIDGHGRQSAFAKASRVLRKMDSVIADEAVRIVVVQSGRSRAAPRRLQQLLASEVLFQILRALSGARSRTIRKALGLPTLDAAGSRILRFG